MRVTINTPCRHNAGVTCDGKMECRVCGWNPDVINKRRNQARRDKLIGNLSFPEWISCSEMMPPEGKEILVFVPMRNGIKQHGIFKGTLKRVPADDGSGNFWGYRRPACDWTLFGWSYFETPLVTHWLPLPAAPKPKIV